jgi:hypothetical protein
MPLFANTINTASCLAVVFAVWGTFVISREDFSISNIEMYEARGNYKYKKDNKTSESWTSAEHNNTIKNTLGDGDDNILDLFDVRLRPPFADIVRMPINSTNTEGNWYNYRKRHHIVGTTTITYDMTVQSHNRSVEDCRSACHGNYGHGANVCAAGDYDNDKCTSFEEACYFLIPGCTKVFNLEDAMPLINKPCTKQMETLVQSLTKSHPNFYVWIINALWLLLFLGNIVVLYAEKDQRKFWLIVLFLISLTIFGMTIAYGVKIDGLVRLKKANDSPELSDSAKNCYGEYYLRAMDYQPDPSNSTTFQWNPKFRLKDSRKPKHRYARGFVRGPRNIYMMAAAVVAFVHLIVYAVSYLFRDFLGVTSGQGMSMQHLSSTLF